MRIFLDTEFTGLHKNTTLISIGLVDEDGRSFYAEFTDYDKKQADEWIEENIIGHLILPTLVYDIIKQCNVSEYSLFVGDKQTITNKLLVWLSSYEEVEIWSDCLAYDWVLFCDLFGGALNLPKNIYYIPFDLATLFRLSNIDPDISREEYCGLSINSDNKHNALWDARVIKACFEKKVSGGNINTCSCL